MDVLDAVETSALIALFVSAKVRLRTVEPIYKLQITFDIVAVAKPLVEYNLFWQQNPFSSLVAWVLAIADKYRRVFWRSPTK